MRRAIVIAAVALGLAACAGILGLRSPGRKPFPHRAHVLAGTTCIQCHRGADRAGDQGPLHLPDDASCVGCHAKPHDQRSCLGCHGGEWTALDASQAREHLRFDHRRHQAASRGNCVRCHAGIQEAGQRLRPAMAVCLGCHEHEGQFRTRECNRCHVDLAGEQTPPASHMVHDADFTRRHGAQAGSSADLCSTCHSERFCAACHGVSVPALPSTMAFDDPFRASVHRAGFASRHAVEAAAQPGACTSCHQPEACQGCHTERRIAATAGASGGTGGAGGAQSASPHPSGWVGLGRGDNEHGRAARRDPAACASCHGGAGEALCVSCHKVGGVGGSVHPPGWSSRQSLGDLPCRLCHTESR
ncbi:MAG TPA: cytochrome c3 family protein [Kofleriaceae bacterium]|nr:cytochrome c3 family protein [Kofleriaceae bacterium]